MGDFDKGNVAESATHNPKSRLKTAIVLILGLFAPIMMSMFNYGWTNDLSIQSMIWMYNSSPYMFSFFGFSLIPPYAWASMFPFLLLRMVPVFQIHRYYNGKTTRKRAFIASFVGDGIFLVLVLPTLIMSIPFSSFYIMLPLPFQMIVAILILWRSPLPTPTTPWESEEKPKSWWDKTSDSPPKKKPTDDDDVLW